MQFSNGDKCWNGPDRSLKVIWMRNMICQLEGDVKSSWHGLSLVDVHFLAMVAFLQVRLRCGLKNELTDVDEPSRCEYIALLSTPTLCLEEKLKELQHKLDLMNTQQPQSHDEL
ncbi:hypothetical protein HHK36_012109 [Tetracentron sinense]|uniref:Glucosidase 2 subunit beta-like domain-containing protein n=1 Tax=Tetracentron sinense TaxID=13715 RepID=A0A835DL38_TETSI|nr:hypothetical protein HHK36_012109 [Tetracentron sinense]